MAAAMPIVLLGQTRTLMVMGKKRGQRMVVMIILMMLKEKTLTGVSR